MIFVIKSYLLYYLTYSVFYKLVNLKVQTILSRLAL